MTDAQKAESAIEAGNLDAALRHAWNMATQAATALDTDRLAQAGLLASTIAEQAEGSTRHEAQQLQAYCTACAEEPNDSAGPFWSFGRLLGRRGPKRKKCPDCAEQIQPDARVCRYCGFRFDDAE